MEGKMSFAQKFGAFSHKLFGTKPNDGDVQPKEAGSVELRYNRYRTKLHLYYNRILFDGIHDRRFGI